MKLNELKLNVKLEERLEVDLSQATWLFYQSRSDIKNKVNELQFLEAVQSFIQFTDMDEDVQKMTLQDIAGGSRTGVAEFKLGDPDFEEMKEYILKKEEGVLTEEDEEKMKMILLKRIKEGGN